MKFQSLIEAIKRLKEYWFDWKIYNPATSVYTLGPTATH